MCVFLPESIWNWIIPAQQALCTVGFSQCEGSKENYGQRRVTKQEPDRSRGSRVHRTCIHMILVPFGSLWSWRDTGSLFRNHGHDRMLSRTCCVGSSRDGHGIRAASWWFSLWEGTWWSTEATIFHITGTDSEAASHYETNHLHLPNTSQLLFFLSIQKAGLKIMMGVDNCLRLQVLLPL